MLHIQLETSSFSLKNQKVQLYGATVPMWHLPAGDKEKLPFLWTSHFSPLVSATLSLPHKSLSIFIHPLGCPTPADLGYSESSHTEVVLTVWGIPLHFIHKLSSQTFS